MFDARNIYRPVFGVEEPVVHTVSICPLDDVAKKGLECRSTGFVGSDHAEMFVTPDSIYLWLSAVSWDDWEKYDCQEIAGRLPSDQVAPAAVMRVPVGRGDPAVLGARGMPFDQFSMDEYRGHFRALVSWDRSYCEREHFDEGLNEDVALVDEPLSSFGQTYRPARGSRFEELPSLQAHIVDNRFVGDWLVYGGRDSYSGRPWGLEVGKEMLHPSAIAVPLGNPAASVNLNQPHNVIRIERVGDDIVINGYRDIGGLSLSYIDLGETARLSSTIRLEKRFESEGRSHAFNSTVAGDGAGMLGVPTVELAEDAGRWWSRSDVSDISYLTFDREGTLGDAGYLQPQLREGENDEGTAPGYVCEVSCIDWYGNARPFFLDGKVYGLMAADLVEAQLVAGKVVELRRLDLTESVATR